MGARARMRWPAWRMGRTGPMLAAALTLGHSAAAEPKPVALGLEYMAPDSCPDRDALIQEVRRRFPVAAVLPNEASRVVVVTIEDREGRYFGTVALRGASGIT